MNGGDTVGARNTIDLLPAGDERKSALEARLADAESRHRQGKAPIIHFTYKSLISKTPSKGLHPSPATSADWLRFVEGDKSELNTLPFLDLAAYLRTLPSRDDAKAYFATVEPTIEDMARLRKDVAKMLTIGIVR
jgi:hypothetical protein